MLLQSVTRVLRFFCFTPNSLQRCYAVLDVSGEYSAFIFRASSNNAVEKTRISHNTMRISLEILRAKFPFLFAVHLVLVSLHNFGTPCINNFYDTWSHSILTLSVDMSLTHRTVLFIPVTAQSVFACFDTTDWDHTSKYRVAHDMSYHFIIPFKL